MIEIEKHMSKGEVINAKLAASLGVGPKILKVEASERNRKWRKVTMGRCGLDLRVILDRHVSLRRDKKFLSDVYYQIGKLAGILFKNGYIHSDLRGANIVVSQENANKVFLVDFDILTKIENKEVYANKVAYIDKFPNSYFEGNLPFDWPLDESMKDIERKSFQKGFFEEYKLKEKKGIYIPRFSKEVGNLFKQKRFPIIVITGPPGSGSTTLAKQLAKKVGYRYISGSQFFRTKTKGIVKKLLKKGNPKELLQYEDVLLEVLQNPDAHYAVDAELFKKIGLGGVVCEGRTHAWVLGPTADVSIYVTADYKTRIQRLETRIVGGIKATREKVVDSELRTVIEKQAAKSMKRDHTDILLYKKVYPEIRKLFPKKKKTGDRQGPYDLIINNNKMSVDQQIKLITETFGEILKPIPFWYKISERTAHDLK